MNLSFFANKELLNFLPFTILRMSYLVLFIHGLTGDSTTFGKFPELLKDDSKLKPSVNVDLWNYPTNWTSYPFVKTNPRIQDLADSLHTELSHREETSIILVCHSLGGIIARRMLLDDRKRKVSYRITHVFLYATPNDGSDLANLAKTISIWQPQLKQLSPTSDFLDSLNSDWHNGKMEKHIAITYIVGALDSVVPMKSAKGFWGNDRVYTIPDGDHSNIVKPTSLNDIRYKIFQKVILGILKQLPEPVVTRKRKITPKISLTCIIVEDEIMARKSMQRLCEKNNSLELLDSFENASDALVFLEENEVDLILLDVEMPGLSGFDLLEQLNYVPFVILTTSKIEYAYDAFQYNVADYIRKPIMLPRFNIAVEKVLDLARKNKQV